jgi:uncharacterized integral membrane protein
MTNEKANGARNIRGWFMTIIAALLLLAGIIFTVMQSPLESEFSIFGRRPLIVTSTALLILFSAIGGIVVFYLLRMLIAGIRILVRQRRARRLTQQPAVQ